MLTALEPHADAPLIVFDGIAGACPHAHTHTHAHTHECAHVHVRAGLYDAFAGIDDAADAKSWGSTFGAHFDANVVFTE